MNDMHASPIEKEYAFFERHRGELVSKAEGEFVLIKDETVIGIYPTRAVAMREGYDRFGPGPFLVHQISLTEEAVNFTSLFLVP